MSRPYDVGFICGRFQTFHKGHQKLIETALLLCDRVLIFVGSAQESGTERNPLNIATRIKMIKSIYDDPNRVIVYALADMTNENDICPEWGKYLLENVDRYIYKAPELMVYGNDASRSGWFDVNDIKQTTELIVNRNELPISATMLRTLMVLGERRLWMQYVDPKLHKMFDELRNEMMEVQYYKELENKLNKILLEGDEKEWQKNTDSLLHPLFTILKK